MLNLELLYKPAAINRGELDGRLVVASNRTCEAGLMHAYQDD
jgi:hypothetical protein